MKPPAAAPRRSTIELHGLTIGYRDRRSVKIVAGGIDACIAGGELTCLLGSNGIGKSTLLRTLSAFQPKLGGKILICGREIERYSPKSLAGLVSVVLTEKPEIKNMTVRDLAALGRSPYTGFWGRVSAHDLALTDRALDAVGIGALAGRMIHTLSDGERQKTMIAKALAQDTPIILLDEPTAFLDFPSKVEIMQLLHRLTRQTQKTIFLSTHDLELALQIADKIWLLDDRAQLRIGTPEDLALDGCLNHFFARKGIVFDHSTGLFRVANDCHRCISLTGNDPILTAMIRKALLRNGIRADADADPAAGLIDASDGRISLIRPDGHRATPSTVEALLNELLTDA